MISEIPDIAAFLNSLKPQDRVEWIKKLETEVKFCWSCGNNFGTLGRTCFCKRDD